MVLPDSLLILPLALAAEAAIGYPDGLYTRIGHPVTWIGRLIKGLDRVLNRDEWSFGRRRAAGILALLILLAITGAAAWALQALLLPLRVIGIAVLAILASSLIAQRSLHEHVAAVSNGLREGGIAGGRKAVSMIVGRNPQSLDEAGVSRAAIESLAENFSDGIVAPAFWLGLGGLPGAVLYKAANTADSMIGHRTPRHEAFGWAAARFDDLVNLPASRLTALLLVAAACLHRETSPRGAWRALRRDASHHRSPNAGWPEAAMAGALGLRLAGPRVYGDVRVEDRWMGDGRAEANADDIDRALALYRTACGLLFALAAGAALSAWTILR
ncbi:adenosylcobinamide-phosphate synthase CbiB [Microvirga zambiensis]|uniref:adenosylcobinamide-phosphate synthase CbiB n=1 Tax=Microvirga zambiensis TaxID=1402137 RepID=UPI00191F0140|nr:adenosylcobinamide-phosphate synthase CbiB [Microvirga zambiensis]